MLIRDIIDLLEVWAPRKYQENYDNSGLIAGDQNQECTGVLVSLDCTEEIIVEAIGKKCNLIVSHHPLVFRAIKSIRPENSTGRILIEAIRRGIVIYAIHTNLDNIISGVNGEIADRLGLVDRKILKKLDDNPEVGSGIVGMLPKSTSGRHFLQSLKETFGVPVVRHSRLTSRDIKIVAICGGAGSFLIPSALEQGVDVFVTADLKYHEFFIPEGQCLLADIGHFESEQYTIDLIHDAIRKKYPNFAVLKSSTVTNPVNYYL